MFTRNLPRSRDWLKQFSWAAGVEDTFVPQFRDWQRPLEEYRLTEHYSQWKNDLALAASLAITQLRWGIPWYLVEPEEGHFEWAWVDQVLCHLINDLHIEPIVDLVHYGTPTWLSRGFLNPRFPQLMARLASAFARRYRGFVQCYTPLNEPTVTADFCGRRGDWPPYAGGEAGYVQILLAVSRGIQLSTEAIRKADPGAVIFAVEATNRYLPQGSAGEKAAAFKFGQDLLCFDLVTGKVDGAHPLWPWLLQHGASADELHNLRQKACRADVFGLNFYPWAAHKVSESANGVPVVHAVTADGRMLADIVMQCSRHVQLPIYVTETSAVGDRRLSWLRETIDGVNSARLGGAPVIGYTWFPFFSMIEWDYRNSNRPLEEHLLHLGLWELRPNGPQQKDGGPRLRRCPTPAVDAYRLAIDQGVVPIGQTF